MISIIQVAQGSLEMVATQTIRVWVHGPGVKKYGHLVARRRRLVEEYLWVGSVVGVGVVLVSMLLSLVDLVVVDTVVVVVVPRVEALGMQLVVLEGLLSTQVYRPHLSQ
tara:strand:+ start:37 stop:363 length:327 start_codon:yes stop_codon:yes gene_type:complete